MFPRMCWSSRSMRFCPTECGTSAYLRSANRFGSASHPRPVGAAAAGDGASSRVRPLEQDSLSETPEMDMVGVNAASCQALADRPRFSATPLSFRTAFPVFSPRTCRWHIRDP